MSFLFATFLAWSLQGTAPTKVPIASLTGTWVSTATSRDAVVSRTFTIAVNADKVTVATPGKPGVEAVVFVPLFKGDGSGAVLLVVRHPATGSLTRWEEIRPLGPDKLSFELHTEHSDGKPAQMYSEEFVRQR